MRSGCSDLKLTLRAGHRSIHILQPYITITGEARKEHTQRVFTEPNDDRKEIVKKTTVEGNSSSDDVLLGNFDCY